jgi:hypothetical protein
VVLPTFYNVRSRQKPFALDRKITGDRLIDCSQCLENRDHSHPIERWLAISLSIVLDGLGIIPNVSYREKSFALDREHWQPSPPLSSIVSISMAVPRVRQRERSVAVDKEISGDRVIDCSQCWITRDNALSIDRSLSVDPSIVSMFSPSVPNVRQQERSFAVD